MSSEDLHQSPTSRQPAHVLARLEIVVPHYAALLQLIFSFVFQKLIVYFTAEIDKTQNTRGGRVSMTEQPRQPDYNRGIH